MRTVLLLVVLGWFASAVASESDRTDPWAWPFARTSIWNTPLGDDAVLIPAGLPVEVDGQRAYHGLDVERHVQVAADDPERPVYPPSSWTTRWPGDDSFPWRDDPQWKMPVPDDFRAADADPPHTPNACVSFLMPDGRELRQLEPTCRLWDDAVPDRRIVGWPARPVDLYGDGIHGAHWGSGLSVLGGSLRLGELSGPEPIRHALKINLWGRHLHYSSEHGGYRWPADRADSYAADQYSGNLPALRMGALLALPPDLSAADLGVDSPPGRKLFAALQTYGAYISDDSAWNAYDLCAEEGVAAEVAAMGFDITGRSGQLVTELGAMVAALAVVDDNGPSTVGGAGERRAAWAPRLVDPNWSAPADLAAQPHAEGVALTWAAPADWSPDAYTVERSVAGGSWEPVATVTSPGHDDHLAPPGSACRWRIRGLDDTTGNAGAWAVSEPATRPQRVITLQHPGDWLMRESSTGRWADSSAQELVLDAWAIDQDAVLLLSTAPSG